jgi:hypothetical protein
MKYDPETGLFDPPCKPGSEGYRRVGQELAHRVAYRLMTGKDAGNQVVDHINCDRSDNRWCNLRLATRSQNRMNSKRKTKGYVCVNGRYVARIYVRGQQERLGTFDTEEEASAAYIARAKEIHGEFYG